MIETIAIVLAAGEGTRMNSSLPKVLHKICGKTLLSHVLSAAGETTDKQIIVIGHAGDKVKQETGEDYTYIMQEQQLGTGHAVKKARDYLNCREVLVLCGDTPLISSEIIQRLLCQHRQEGALGTVLTAELPSPAGYGRIVRGEGGSVLKIIEESEATEQEKKIEEINTGTYCFDGPSLGRVLDDISRKNRQGEYYLTDVMEILSREGKTAACLLPDYRLALGVNTKEQLAEASRVKRELKNRELMLAGVTLIDPATTYIDMEVEIGADTIIYPGTIIEGKSKIGANCILGPDSQLVNAILGDGVVLRYSVVMGSFIGNRTTVGPFAYIRPESEIEQDVKIGDFVEIKKSKIGAGSKVPHLSYVGDAQVGSGVNLGAGTIVVNYDGKKKHRTIIGEGSFVGCNSNLIAPLEIGKESFIAAGSTINKDVPSGSFVLARSDQLVKKGLAKKFLRPKAKE